MRIYKDRPEAWPRHTGKIGFGVLVYLPPLIILLAGLLELGYAIWQPFEYRHWPQQTAVISRAVPLSAGKSIYEVKTSVSYRYGQVDYSDRSLESVMPVYTCHCNQAQVEAQIREQGFVGRSIKVLIDPEAPNMPRSTADLVFKMPDLLILQTVLFGFFPMLLLYMIRHGMNISLR